MIFRGISNLTIDAKGRMAIPARYRDAFLSGSSGQAIITVDHTDKCLLVYTLEQWMKVEQTLMMLPNMNPQVRNMMRLIIGHASEVEFDAQGRVLISQPLRDYAGLEKKAVLVGVANKFELWDADRWFAARDEWIAEAQDNSVETVDVLNQVSI